MKFPPAPRLRLAASPVSRIGETTGNRPVSSRAAAIELGTVGYRPTPFS
jgi:hypothetical protein